MIADYAPFTRLCGAKSAAFRSDSLHKQVCLLAIGFGPEIALDELMTPDELKHRTKTFAIEVIKLAKSLPSDYLTAHIARQMVRSGTSVGANYRSSCRAKSEADFIAKMSIVEEEADETGYWLELLVETNRVTPKAVAATLSEADQLVRIAVASIKTARGRSR